MIYFLLACAGGIVLIWCVAMYYNSPPKSDDTEQGVDPNGDAS